MGSLQGMPPARHQVWTHFQARTLLGNVQQPVICLRRARCPHPHVCCAGNASPVGNVQQVGVCGEGHDVCIHILSCANDASPLVEDVQQIGVC